MNREGNLQGEEARTGGRANEVYAQIHFGRSKVQRGRSARRKASAVTPEGEWQKDKRKMRMAVHLFHKDGDSALEKLIPARAVKMEYKKALAKGIHEVDRLANAGKQSQLDLSKANGALLAVEKGIEEQDALKRMALKAREEGKEYAEKMRVADLKRKLELQVLIMALLQLALLSVVRSLLACHRTRVKILFSVAGGARPPPRGYCQRGGSCAGERESSPAQNRLESSARD